MNTTTKYKRLEALRSGNYKQAYGKLQTEDGYCCLGVLAVVTDRTIRPDGLRCENSETYSPNYDFTHAEGISGGQATNLISMNDHDRATFPDIADWIEENL